MKYSKYVGLIFPLLIVLIGLFIYKVLGYEADFYTIIINMGVAFILSPRVKTLDTQAGKQQQITWLFFKKSYTVN
tara:strand:- start:25091 stop:25315 length:225 start_codon:yes stop_codon:yes gene_type:complete